MKCAYLIRGVYCTKEAAGTCTRCHAPLCEKHLRTHYPKCWKKKLLTHRKQEGRTA